MMSEDRTAQAREGTRMATGQTINAEPYAAVARSIAASVFYRVPMHKLREEAEAQLASAIAVAFATADALNKREPDNG